MITMTYTVTGWVARSLEDVVPVDCLPVFELGVADPPASRELCLVRARVLLMNAGHAPWWQQKCAGKPWGQCARSLDWRDAASVPMGEMPARYLAISISASCDRIQIRPCVGNCYGAPMASPSQACTHSESRYPDFGSACL